RSPRRGSASGRARQAPAGSCRCSLPPAAAVRCSASTPAGRSLRPATRERMRPRAPGDNRPRSDPASPSSVLRPQIVGRLLVRNRVSAPKDRLARGHLALADLENALGLLAVFRPRAVGVTDTLRVAVVYEPETAARLLVGPAHQCFPPVW